MRLSSDTQAYPNTQMEEEGKIIIPFAKCSRVVSRISNTSLPSQSLSLTPKNYGDFFWESISQRPSLAWMEEQYIPPPLRVSGSSQPDLYRPEGLLPPEMLCRRKRRSHVSGMHQGPGGIPAQVRAVTYHLEDLRRRQRISDELKKAQWGNSGAVSVPLMLDGDCRFTQCPDREEERAPYPREEDRCLKPGRAQLLWSPWSPQDQEGSCSSRQHVSCSIKKLSK